MYYYVTVLKALGYRDGLNGSAEIVTQFIVFGSASNGGKRRASRLSPSLSLQYYLWVGAGFRAGVEV